MTDIETLIESLSPEEIRTIMDEVRSNKPTRVDTSRKMRSMLITDLYFQTAPRQDKGGPQKTKLTTQDPCHHESHNLQG